MFTSLVRPRQGVEHQNALTITMNDNMSTARATGVRSTRTTFSQANPCAFTWMD